MKRDKFVLASIAILVTLLLSVVYVSAITASIGNARMVLRAEEGDVIERTILVKNVNDVPVSVELVPNGELANSIEILDENIELEVGEERKVSFKLTVTKNEKTESYIDVKFIPEEGNSVGLRSTIIVLIGEGSLTQISGDSNDDPLYDNYENQEDVVIDPETSNNLGNNLLDADKGFNNLFVLTALVLIAVLVTLYFYKPKKNKSSKE